MSFVVAIDGPAAAGKGTISKAVAQRFNLSHLDSGLLYRAVGRRVLGGEDALAAARALVAEDLQGAGLRGSEVARAASKVAALPEVREALVDFQRDFARRPEGVVIDGRDIGTVICPDADVKLFVTASDRVRAERRLIELRERGEAADYESVLAAVRDRDRRDMERESSPLKPADDAEILDTSDMTIDEALARASAIIEARR